MSLQEGLLVRTPAASPAQQRPKSKPTLDGLDSTSFNLVVSTQALLDKQQQQQQQESTALLAGNGGGTATTPSSNPAARALQLSDARGDEDAKSSQQASDEPATAADTVDGSAPRPEPAAAAGTPATPSRASRAQLSRAIENNENRAPDGESRRSKILRRIGSMRAKFAEAEAQMQC